MSIYARWRGSSDRPARSFHLARRQFSFGGQAQGDASRDLVGEGRLGALSIVVGDPGHDPIAGLSQIAEGVNTELRDQDRVHSWVPLYCSGS